MPTTLLGWESQDKTLSPCNLLKGVLTFQLASHLPGHRQALQYAEEQGQPLLMPLTAAEKRERASYNFSKCCSQPSPSLPRQNCKMTVTLLNFSMTNLRFRSEIYIAIKYISFLKFSVSTNLHTAKSEVLNKHCWSNRAETETIKTLYTGSLESM